MKITGFYGALLGLALSASVFGGDEGSIQSARAKALLEDFRSSAAKLDTQAPTARERGYARMKEAREDYLRFLRLSGASVPAALNEKRPELPSMPSEASYDLGASSPQALLPEPAWRKTPTRIKQPSEGRIFIVPSYELPPEWTPESKKISVDLSKRELDDSNNEEPWFIPNIGLLTLVPPEAFYEKMWQVWFKNPQGVWKPTALKGFGLESAIYKPSYDYTKLNVCFVELGADKDSDIRFMSYELDDKKPVITEFSLSREGASDYRLFWKVEDEHLQNFPAVEIKGFSQTGQILFSHQSEKAEGNYYVDARFSGNAAHYIILKTSDLAGNTASQVVEH